MRLSSISLALTRLGQRLGRWSPLALWPNGVDSPGMWIDPSLLSASFNDYTGTTPVATPGSVADSANPVGLALDIRAGATALADPGNHMLQSTSAARPVASALVNLLTYTEDLLNTWSNYQSTILTATTFSFDDQYANVRKAVSSPTGTAVTIQMQAAAISGNTALCIFHEGAVEGDYTAITVSGTPQLFTVTVTTAGIGYINVGLQDRNASGHGVAYLSKIQVNIGAEALTYQSVPGDGSTYDATGITPWQAYDGTDDGMATASFAAGTLINGMDCLIAVRRDSAARMIVGLYNTAGDGTRYFGEATNDPGAFVCFSGVGTPTVWLDGVQLSGGTAVTIGTLYNALTVGSWHILEFRGLNLSTWTQLSYGGYPAWYVNGALGDIQLFASGQDANRDKARAQMAAYFGVTLP